MLKYLWFCMFLDFRPNNSTSAHWIPLNCLHLRQKGSVKFLPSSIHWNDKIKIKSLIFGFIFWKTNVSSGNGFFFEDSLSMKKHYKKSPVQRRLVAEHFSGYCTGGWRLKDANKRLFRLQMPFNLFGGHMAIRNWVCVNDRSSSVNGIVQFLLYLFSPFRSIGILIWSWVWYTVFPPLN